MSYSFSRECSFSKHRNLHRITFACVFPENKKLRCPQAGIFALKQEPRNYGIAQQLRPYRLHAVHGRVHGWFHKGCVHHRPPSGSTEKKKGEGVQGKVNGTYKSTCAGKNPVQSVTRVERVPIGRLRRENSIRACITNGKNGKTQNGECENVAEIERPTWQVKWDRDRERVTSSKLQSMRHLFPDLFPNFHQIARNLTRQRRKVCARITWIEPPSPPFPLLILELRTRVTLATSFSVCFGPLFPWPR